MTPYELGMALSDALGAPVRLRPVTADDPTRWRTTALLDHATRDPNAVASAHELALATPGVEVAEGVLTLVLDDVDGALDLTPASDDVEVVRRLLQSQWRPAAELWLTRDSRPTSYADLAARAGDASARWVRARSSDGTRIDVPLDRLGSRTLDDPSFAVLLAHDRIARGRAGEPTAAAVTAVLQTPMVLAESVRTSRTRPVMLHLEALAREVLAGAGAAPQPPVTWTPARAADRARIVLASGLHIAGIPAPAQI